MIFRITGPSGKPAPVVFAYQAINTGVMKTPSRLETVALKIATGTLPRASEVIATDDDTVEGKAATKKKPSQTSGG